jgi:predicted N-acetyltransferase YhbS
MQVRVVPCGVERAVDVHLLTQQAFRRHRSLDPPSGAVRETLAKVREDLAAGGGAIAELHGRAVGCLRWSAVDGRTVHVRRLAVTPEFQRQGIGRLLMEWAEAEARRRGCGAVLVGVRLALTGNVEFYRRLGYVAVAEHCHEGYERATWMAMEKRLHAAHEDQAAMDI